MTRKSKNRERGGVNVSSLIQSVVKSVESDDVCILSGADTVEKWLPSTNMAINYIIGDVRYGALPFGRIAEIFGPRSSGKSLLVYDFLKQIQRLNGIGVLSDAEHAFVAGYGRYLGIDTSKLIYATPGTIEETTDFVIDIIETVRSKDLNVPLLVSWDSMAACTTLREDDTYSEDGKSEMGYRARLMSEQMRKIQKLMDPNTIYLVINQIRKKIGIMFGDPDTTPGGQALPFHASTRTKVTKTKKLYRNKGKKKIIYGHKVKIYGDKNRVRPPFAMAEINVYVDKVNQRYGLDKWSGMLDLLVGDGIVRKVKKHYEVGDIEFGKEDIGEIWDEHILPAIPEDLYAGTGENDK